jgi:hypothetical protein
MLPNARRSLTYVNVAVIVILVFTMTSGTYAASRYLITSIKQISPQVLNQLSSKFGRPWKAENSLHSNKTEVGVWGFSTTNLGAVRVPLSFPIPLAKPINADSVDVIEPGQEGKQFTKECPGTIEKPAAIPGYLCVYSSVLDAPYLGDGAPHTGGIVLVFNARTNNGGIFGISDEGTWAVTGN